jgi:hypothetical protein
MKFMKSLMAAMILTSATVGIVNAQSTPSIPAIAPPTIIPAQPLFPNGLLGKPNNSTIKAFEVPRVCTAQEAAQLNLPFKDCVCYKGACKENKTAGVVVK